MGWIKDREDLILLLKKYGAVILVLIVGILLMMLPEKTQQDAITSDKPDQIREQDLSEQLEAILSRLSGAGKVSVLLTKATGSVTHYQTDQNQSTRADSGDLRQDTVIITDGSRNQTGLVRRVDPPVYQGAVILCQGADSPAVRLAVVDAVCKATGLTSDKISVLKMK